MELRDSIIQAFLEDAPLSSANDIKLLGDYITPDCKRKDIVRELLTQLESIVKGFPTFNTVLWNELFQQNKALESILILPVVGSEPIGNRVERTTDGYLIVIDLIHIANYTQIVSQMVYVLQNYITFEITKICIHETYPSTSKHYLDLLDHMTFTNGLANYLSWNENCKDYKFYTEKYDIQKEKAFGLLAQTKDIANKAMQHKVLMNVVQADFWNQFPSTAGMFYFDDTYRDFGNKGIEQLYKRGPKNFVQLIFNS